MCDRVLSHYLQKDSYMKSLRSENGRSYLIGGIHNEANVSQLPTTAYLEPQVKLTGNQNDKVWKKRIEISVEYVP